MMLPPFAANALLFSLLPSITLAFPSIPNVVAPIEVNISSLETLSNGTVGVSPWSPAPFEWKERGLVNFLPMVRDVSVTCVDYEAWPFSASDRYAFLHILIDYLRHIPIPPSKLVEKTHYLDISVPGSNVRVLVLNSANEHGERHTSLSVAETLWAYRNLMLKKGIAHAATLVPRTRRLPLIPWTSYRPIRIEGRFPGNSDAR